MPIIEKKNPNENAMMKKKENINYESKPVIKKTSETDASTDDFIDAPSVFPRSYPLYRLGIPAPE